MSTVRELDGAPDWLTVTTATYRDTSYLRQVAELYLFVDSGVRPWRLRDYAGRQRHDAAGAGGVAFGDRDCGCYGILQAWGAMSGIIGRHISDRKLKATRVDLAVTVLHEHAQRSVQELMQDLNPAKCHYSAVIAMDAGGGTLYIGHRASDAYARLYDKGWQLKGDIPPRTLWRYEVEYKRHLAKQAADALWYSNPSMEQMRSYVLANVETFFHEHGVPTPFTASDASQHSLVRYATRIQDSARTIKWLSEQVQPALLKLQERGMTSHIIQALGIGVQDGVPIFEANEVIPPRQDALWQELDKSDDPG